MGKEKISLVGTIISAMEKRNVPLLEWVLAFLAIVAIRSFIEGFVTQQGFFPFVGLSPRFYFIHLPLFYAVSFVGAIAILHFWSREKITKVSAFVLSLMLILFLPITIDAIVGTSLDKHTGTSYQYFQTPMPWPEFFTFFANYVISGPLNLGLIPDGKFVQLGNNYGIHIEIAVLLAVAFWYVFEKTGSLLRGVGALVFFAAGLFPLSFVIPMVTQLSGLRITEATLSLGASHFPEFTIRHMYSVFLLGLLIPIVGYVWYRYNPKEFASMMKNLRPNRTVHVVVLVVLGAVLGSSLDSESRTWDSMDLIVISVAILAMILEWFSAVCHNDIADRKGDAVSMTDRPIVTGTVSVERMKEFAIVSLFLSYSLAIFVSGVFFVFILTKSAISYLYSSSTFRFKAIPIIANLALAGAYLITLMSGYALVLPGSVLDFPFEIALAMLVFYTLATPFKDIKDYEGDKIDGIVTIPGIFGLERGKKIIGGMGIAGCLSVPLILGDVSAFTLTASTIG